MMEMIFLLGAGLIVAWPAVLLSVASAWVLGALQRLMMVRCHWSFRGAVIPAVASIVWIVAFSASGLVGNLGALFVFGPSIILWPLALCIGSTKGQVDKPEGGDGADG